MTVPQFPFDIPEYINSSDEEDISIKPEPINGLDFSSSSSKKPIVSLNPSTVQGGYRQRARRRTSSIHASACSSPTSSESLSTTESRRLLTALEVLSLQSQHFPKSILKSNGSRSSRKSQKRVMLLLPTGRETKRFRNYLGDDSDDSDQEADDEVRIDEDGEEPGCEDTCQTDNLENEHVTNFKEPKEEDSESSDDESDNSSSVMLSHTQCGIQIDCVKVEEDDILQNQRIQHDPSSVTKRVRKTELQLFHDQQNILSTNRERKPVKQFQPTGKPRLVQKRTAIPAYSSVGDIKSKFRKVHRDTVQLVKIDLSDCQLNSIDALEPLAENFPTLRSINLTNNNISDIRVLKPLAKLSSLEKLMLGSRIDREAIFSMLPQLKFLDRDEKSLNKSQ
uniref:Acidic leucine-rich nuclear phosphoprotein 32 family member B n=1 Tax=Ditylenchus dipsaci TaxID=166011 RepID=A0A915D6Q8_9BILA